MLDKMREHGGNWMVKVALALISLVFVFWGFGANKITGDNYAIKVNGTIIPIDRYEQVYKRVEEQQRENKDMPEDMKEKYIAEQVADILVENELLSEFADAHGLAPDKSEIADEIMHDQNFQDDKGNFIGKQKYLELLKENNLDPEVYEAGIAEQLKVDKARTFLESSVKVTPQEVKNEFDRRNEKVNLTYVKVDAIALAGSLKDLKVADSEIDAWDKAHQGDAEKIYNEELPTRYTIPAKVQLLEITVRKPQPGKKDYDDQAATAKRRADKALEEAKTDFKKAAGEFSEGAPWEKSGQPREFSRRDLMAKVADTVFPAAGATESPAKDPTMIETPTSYVIAQVKSYTPDKITPLDEPLKKSIIVEQIRTEKAKQEVETFAKEAFAKLKAGTPIDKVAALKGLAVKETGAFPRRDEIPGVPDADATLAHAAFALTKPGEVLASGDAPPKVGDGYLLAVLKAHTMPSPDDFEKQKMWVEAGLERQRSQEAFRVWKAEAIAKAKILENPQLVRG